MKTTAMFVKKGILKYLSCSAMLVGAASALVMSPAQAKEKPAKAVATKGAAAKSAPAKAAPAKAQEKSADKGKKAAKHEPEDKKSSAAKGKVTAEENGKKGKAAATVSKHAKAEKESAKGGKAHKAVEPETKAAAGKRGHAAHGEVQAKAAAGKANTKMTAKQRAAEQQRLAAEAKEAERQKRLAEAKEAERQKRIAEAKEAERQKRIAEAKEAERQKRLTVARARAQEDRLATEMAERNARIRSNVTPITPSATAAIAAAALGTTLTSGNKVATPAVTAAFNTPSPNVVAAPAPVPAAQPVADKAPVVAVIPPVEVTRPVTVSTYTAPSYNVPVNNSPVVRTAVPSTQRLGEVQGMTGAPVGLNSSVAFVMDQNTGEVLFSKNGGFVSPIASITKLMTALVVMDANLPMDERITITNEDVDYYKRSSSRLTVGATFTRQQLLHLALMSSENRAAHALGRTYPGGMPALVNAMNQRAAALGMRNSRFVESTGLRSGNRASARDLAYLAKAAYSYPLIRNYTTYPGAQFEVAGQWRNYNNTNRLIHSDDWNIGLQKTGFISEAGRCVVMQSNIAGRNVIIVLLDSNSSNLRAQDAEAIRTWMLQNQFNRSNRVAMLSE